MNIEELKDLLHKLDSKEICELLSNGDCNKCFCQTEEKNCILSTFSEGMLNEIGSK
jgi:hypothetical protein|nr:MAG TPA: Mannan-binding lectin serine protease 2 vitro evolution, specific inhibitor.28A [Caudoviricetes sp.]